VVVHGHMVIAIMVTSECVDELGIKVWVVIILYTYASRYIREAYTWICL